MRKPDIPMSDSVRDILGQAFVMPRGPIPEIKRATAAWDETMDETLDRTRWPACHHDLTDDGDGGCTADQPCEVSDPPCCLATVATLIRRAENAEAEVERLTAEVHALKVACQRIQADLDGSLGLAIDRAEIQPHLDALDDAGRPGWWRS